MIILNCGFVTCICLSLIVLIMLIYIFTFSFVLFDSIVLNHTTIIDITFVSKLLFLDLISVHTEQGIISPRVTSYSTYFIVVLISSFAVCHVA